LLVSIRLLAALTRILSLLTRLLVRILPLLGTSIALLILLAALVRIVLIHDLSPLSLRHNRRSYDGNRSVMTTFLDARYSPGKTIPSAKRVPCWRSSVTAIYVPEASSSEALAAILP
jgi:hypothetical protein